MPGKPIRKMGSYAAGTAPQLQGKASNQSQADLDALKAANANAGVALRQAAPVGGGTYAQFQQGLHSPQGQAQKAAYEQQQGVDRLSNADYQQRAFGAGMGALKARAQANPTQSVLSGAPLQAGYAANNARALAQGNYADTGTAAVTAASLADRSRKLPAQSAYAAPGAAMGPGAAQFAKGTRKMMVKPYADGTKRVATSPFSEVDDQGAETPDNDPAPAENATPEAPMAAMTRKMRPAAAELPEARDAGPKKPADYQEAAAVIRSTPALKAQYRAGVASGKAFSMQIGGKTFKYAATPGKAAAPAAQAPAFRSKAETDRAWNDYAGSTPAPKAADANAAADANWNSIYGQELAKARGGKRAMPQTPRKMSAAAESQATPDDTASNAAIGLANRRKMKAS